MTTKYTVNCQFLRFYGKIHSKLSIFRVKSVKIYTGQKKFMSVATVTNIRYGDDYDDDLGGDDYDDGPGGGGVAF